MPSPIRVGSRTYSANMVDQHLKMSAAQEVNLVQPQLGRPLIQPCYGFKVYTGGSVIRYGWPHFFVDELWYLDRKVATVTYTGDGYVELLVMQHPGQNFHSHRETQFLNTAVTVDNRLYFAANSKKLLRLYKGARPRKIDIERMYNQYRLYGGSIDPGVGLISVSENLPAMSIPMPQMQQKWLTLWFKSRHGVTLAYLATGTVNFNAYGRANTFGKSSKNTKFSTLKVMYRIGLDIDQPLGIRRLHFVAAEADGAPVKMKMEEKLSVRMAFINEPYGRTTHSLSVSPDEHIPPAFFLPSRLSPEGARNREVLQRGIPAFVREMTMLHSVNTYALERYRELLRSHYDLPKD